jgi:hypothetical protein
VAARSITSPGFRDRRSSSPRFASQHGRLHQDRAQRVAQIVGDDAEHVVAQLDRVLGDPVEAGLLHRQGGARRHGPGEGEILRREMAARRGADEDQRADHPAVRQQRQRHERLRIQLTHQLTVLGVLRNRVQVCRRDVANQQRLLGVAYHGPRIRT